MGDGPLFRFLGPNGRNVLSAALYRGRVGHYLVLWVGSRRAGTDREFVLPLRGW